MEWIIQDSNGKHYHWVAMHDAALRTGSKACYCTSEMLARLEDDGEQPVVLGGDEFVLAAKNNPWLRKGVYDDDSFFSVESYLKIWGQDMLNCDTELIRPSALSFVSEGHYFIRPVNDWKCFDGGVRHLPEEAGQLMAYCRACEKKRYNCRICISSPKQIDQEWRAVIISGKPISISQYAHFGRTCVDSGSVPKAVLDFCAAHCRLDSAPPAWIMDVGSVGNHLKIIECNLFNASNYYDCDRESIAIALEQTFHH